MPSPFTVNGICPYFTMFPLSFPLAVIQRASDSGWVFDPFCGRGTSNFAARVLGRHTIAVDSSPVAVAITSAKLAATSVDLVVSTAQRILRGAADVEVPQGEFWELAFERSVLRKLCQLRQALLEDARSDSRKALRALLLGALHGPTPKRAAASYFSNQSQRTYAPKPDYAVRFWRSRGLVPSKVNVAEIIRRRAERFFTNLPKKVDGRVIRGDATDPATYDDARFKRVSLVITSPPYFGLRTYLPDQWLRLWFLGGADFVDYGEERQIRHGTLHAFEQALTTVWRSTAAATCDHARMVVRFGSLSSRPVDPVDVLRRTLRDTGWRIQTVKQAGVSSHGRRQADHFRAAGEARAEFDFWCVRE